MTASNLTFDGERVVPGQTPIYLVWAHAARYRFARQIMGQVERVLDAGSGEGYGTHYLSQQSQRSFGVDIDPVAAGHAQRRYAGAGLQYTAMDCCRLAFASGTFQFVSSFEVIEHFTAVDDYLAEISRVMAPGGRFIVSTPNAERTPAGVNQFHEHEYTPEEFRQVLDRHFPRVDYYGQHCLRPLREKLFMESTRLYLTVGWYRRLLNSFAGLYFRGERANDESTRKDWVDQAGPNTFEFRPGSMSQATYLVAVCHKSG